MNKINKFVKGIYNGSVNFDFWVYYISKLISYMACVSSIILLLTFIYLFILWR